MKISELKQILNTIDAVAIQLENGTTVPQHFHITEIGEINKRFIDCGGTVRNEKTASFQLWNANDFEHRLTPEKIQKIIALSENVLQLEDSEIEVEYQSDTIGKYDLTFDGKNFILSSKKTACLASDHCGIPQEKLPLSELKTSCCASEGCC